MINTNCLENIACPQCGHADSFIIEVKTRADVTDEGAATFGDMFWDERSFIECKNCETGGTVAEFTREEPEQDARKMAAQIIEAQAYLLDLLRHGQATISEGDFEYNGTVYAFDAAKPDWTALVNAIRR